LVRITHSEFVIGCSVGSYKGEETRGSSVGCGSFYLLCVGFEWVKVEEFEEF
jgi:hypothetical protein